MLRRRDLVALSAAGLFVPRRLLAADGSSNHKFLFVYCYGGWDTTMVFTDFFVPFPDALVPRLAGLGRKILYGSDFPNLPYDYTHQLEGLANLLGRAPGLDEDWLARVCWHNAAGLFPTATEPDHE